MSIRQAEEWVRLVADPATGLEALRARFVQHAYDRHAHETYAIGMTETGSQSYRCRGAGYSTRPGALMLFNPAEVHDGRPTDAGGFTYRMLYLPVPLLRDLGGEGFGAPGAEPLFRQPLAQDEMAARVIAEAFDSLAEPDTRLRRDEALLGVLGILLPRYAGLAPRQAPPAAPGLRRARDLLEASLLEDIGIAALAREAGISRFHLARGFRRLYGLSPSEYRRQQRLREARRRIVAGASLADAALASGFTDQAHFTRQFKAAYGVTPGRWRQAAMLPG